MIRRWLARFVRWLVPAAVLGALVVAQAPVPAAAEFEEASLAGSAAENATSPAGWEVMEPPAELMEGGCPGLVSVWGSSPSDVFAISGIGTLFHYDGSEWSLFDAGPLVSDSGYTELGAGMRGIWGSSTSDIYAVGDYSWHQAFVFHWDGSTWTRPAAEYGDCSSISDVWCSSSSDVFAVAYEGCTESCRIHHYDGVSWDVYYATDNTHPLYDTWVSGIWGTSSSDVFAVGSGWSNGAGAVLHYDGSGWSRAHTDPTAGLSDIWGSGSSDVFAVGNHGTVIHYDGSAWSPMYSGTTVWLDDVWGSSPCDVFASGYDWDTLSNIMLHYDGNRWSPMATGTTTHLYDIWGTSSDIFAVGAGGTILHYAGNRRPDQPGNAVPSNGAAGVSLTPALRSSAFWDPDEGDTHAASQWQITTTVDNCTRPVFDSGVDTSNLTQIAVTSGTLGYSSEYCWRVRHQDSRGAWSAWSAQTCFTTAAAVTGWELQQGPLNTGSLRAVWGSSSSDVFVVGDLGTIMHYDGSTWISMSSGTTNDLNGIWGTSSSDVFAIGDHGTVIRYNGSGWADISIGWGSWSRDLRGIWGSSPSNVFVVADDGVVMQYNGGVWTPQSSPTVRNLHGIWGSSSSDVFVVGDYGDIAHFGGGSWNWMASGTTIDLQGIWGSSSSDMFAVGYGGTILHYSAGAWTAMESGITCDLYGVWGSSSSDVFVVGSGAVFHFDGSVWSYHGSVAGGSGIWGSSSSDVFAVGRSCVYHYDGQWWGHMVGSASADLVGIWGSSTSDVVAIGGHGASIHYDGDNWSLLGPGLSPEADCDYSWEDMWGTSSSDRFVVGRLMGFGAFIWHNGGRAEAPMPDMESSVERFLGVWGNSSSDVFAVGGNGCIVHYDGTTWSRMTSGTTTTLTDVWGSSSSDVFAVGSDWETGNNIILHYDGSQWSAMTSGVSGGLNGVWVDSPSDVFAVGSGGTILHYDGDSWSRMDSGTANDLLHIWGSSAANVFAVGSAGTILYYDGREWSPMISGTTSDLRSIWGASASDVFAVGQDCTILHSVGASPPAAETGSAVNIGAGSADLTGCLSRLGTASSARVSFEWGLTVAYGNTTAPQTVTSTGAFSAVVGGLSPDTTYHHRAVAVGDGTAYGDDMTFTTAAEVAGPGSPEGTSADSIGESTTPDTAAPPGEPTPPGTPAGESRSLEPLVPEAEPSGDGAVAAARVETDAIAGPSAPGEPTAGARLWLYPVALVGGFLALSAAASFGAWLRGRVLS